LSTRVMLFCVTRRRNNGSPWKVRKVSFVILECAGEAPWRIRSRYTSVRRGGALRRMSQM
jgi:hypothetical protein